MDHVAILSKGKKRLLDKIVKGEKTIESRWYVNKVAPWEKINSGDRVFFKETGEKVTAVTTVAKVLQFENLNPVSIANILQRYGKEIGFDNNNQGHVEWQNDLKSKNYCILIFLKDVKKTEPFEINKKGFGVSSAWLCVNNILNVKIT